ncbi:MAG TPA: PhzF family phenazine biosynthesis protein [Gemmatimonadaceae bacterium]|nr:PhzF family phenazine biosynthesis protein [Gemmatimonadaceae bacterium]
MKYRYYICDVFSERRFGGNQLAVLPDARGLSTEQMQLITREFNFSETSFVLPPQSGHTRNVRIFTPTAEIPFAGHPNVGTAFVLASIGELGSVDKKLEITFEEKAGLVDISVERRNGTVWAELKAPQTLSRGKTVSAERAASAVSLQAKDVVIEAHEPTVASVGLPFLVAEVGSRSALERAKARLDVMEELKSEGVSPDVYVYVRSGDEFDIRARVFAPLDGVIEDPATGSANCALAALLSDLDARKDGDFTFRIAQGVEMGRPSVLEARTRKEGGKVVSTWIGGASVMVSEGTIEVG